MYISLNQYLKFVDKRFAAYLVDQSFKCTRQLRTLDTATCQTTSYLRASSYLTNVRVVTVSTKSCQCSGMLLFLEGVEIVDKATSIYQPLSKFFHICNLENDLFMFSYSSPGIPKVPFHISVWYLINVSKII